MQYADTSTYGYSNSYSYFYIDEMPSCILCDKYPCQCPLEVTDEQWIFLTGSKLVDILRWLYDEYKGIVHALDITSRCRSPTI